MTPFIAKIMDLLPTDEPRLNNWDRIARLMETIDEVDPGTPVSLDKLGISVINSEEGLLVSDGNNRLGYLASKLGLDTRVEIAEFEQRMDKVVDAALGRKKAIAVGILDFADYTDKQRELLTEQNVETRNPLEVY